MSENIRPLYNSCFFLDSGSFWLQLLPELIGVVIGGLLATGSGFLLFYFERKSNQRILQSSIEESVRYLLDYYVNCRNLFEDLNFRVAEYDGYIDYLAGINGIPEGFSQPKDFQTKKHETIVQRDEVSLKLYGIQAQLSSKLQELSQFDDYKNIDFNSMVVMLTKSEIQDISELKALTNNPNNWNDVDKLRREFQQKWRDTLITHSNPIRILLERSSNLKNGKGKLI
jgi:hypothetical protein